MTLTPEIIGPELPNIYDDRVNNPGWEFFHTNTECNPYVPPGYVQSIKENNVRERWNCLLWGAFSSFQGAVYFMFDPKIHVREDYELKPEWPRVIGVDPGLGGKFAVIWAAYDPINQTWIIYDEYIDEAATFSKHVKAIKERHADADKAMIFFDPAVPDVKRELNSIGLTCYGAKRDLEPGINEVRNYLDRFGANNEPRFVVLSRCKRVIEQMKLYRWHPLQPGQVIKEGEDFCDAVRYGLYSYRAYITKASPQPKPMTPGQQQAQRWGLPLGLQRHSKSLDAIANSQISTKYVHGITRHHQTNQQPIPRRAASQTASQHYRGTGV